MPGKNVPFPPMEAELVAELPTGDWQYEPKWDGFRGVLENDGGELEHGGTQGSPVSPLLHTSARPTQHGLRSGKARLRPRSATTIQLAR